MRVLLTGAMVAFAKLSLASPILLLQVAGQANGEIKINLRDDLAPQHVERIVTLTNEGAYNDVVFHRVLDGFMAQTGDVEFGKREGENIDKAGNGSSGLPDLPAEFSDIIFDRGVVGMARASDPNSANSQFFIMFGRADWLDGQYTVVGEVMDGLDVLDQIKKGSPNFEGRVEGAPDYIVSATIEGE